MSFNVFETYHAQLGRIGKKLCFRHKNLSCATDNVHLTLATLASLNEKNYFCLLFLGDKESRGR